jgi:hypothetical protein
MKDLQTFLEGIPAQELAKVLHRNGGSAKRDQQALIVMYGKLAGRFKKLGLELSVGVDYRVPVRKKKFQAWKSLYGHQETPDVTWNDFFKDYAFGVDEDGVAYAYKTTEND